MSGVGPLREVAIGWRANAHLRREAFTMSLYVAIVLLSALSVLSDRAPSRGAVFALILGTTIGLVLAHGFAGWAAIRIIGDDGDDATWDGLRAQLGGAAVVATAAMVAVAVASTANELAVARATVSATIAALVFVESNRHGSTGRAAVHGLLALVAAVAVAWLKTVLVH